LSIIYIYIYLCVCVCVYKLCINLILDFMYNEQLTYGDWWKVTDAVVETYHCGSKCY